MITNPGKTTPQANPVINLRDFLQLFSPVIDNHQHAAALRFLYGCTRFQHLAKGTVIPLSKLAPDQFIIVSEGLINGFTVEALFRQDIWIGVSGSILISDRFSIQNMLIEALESSRLLILDAKALEAGCVQYPIINRLFSHLLYPKAVSGLEHISHLFRLDNASARKGYLEKTYPGIEKRLSPAVYAAYIEH